MQKETEVQADLGGFSNVRMLTIEEEAASTMRCGMIQRAGLTN